MEVPIEQCTSARVYKPDPIRRIILVVLLVAMYAISIPYCYITAGEPRKTAMIQAQKLADEKWAADITLQNDSNSTSFVNEIIFDTPEEKPSLIDKVDTSLNVHDEFSDDGQVQDSIKSEKSGQSGNWLMSWFTESKEQKRSKQEFDKWAKDLKEKSGEIVSLPPEYLPSAWACLAIFVTLSLHALYYLMCHWVVAFKAVTLFKPATKVEDDCMVLVTPPPNRGQPALVPIKKAPGTGTINTPYIEFQRQKYMYLSAAKLGSDNAKKYKNGVFSLTAYPVALPIQHYLQASGIPSEGEVVKLTEKWGKNHLAVAIPSFLELLKLQLLSPLAIFQVFCAVLWLLDEYWSYTFFTLVSVVMYEATTVFQRTRTQQMLGGMSPKPSPIYAYRANKWSIITTKDLLPGDIISLSFKKRASGNKPNLLPSAATPANANSVVTPGGNTNTPPTAVVASTNTGEDEKKAPITSRDDIVPCDCVLLRGSAVVNEASLTGESVPQMKEAVSSTEKGYDSHSSSSKLPTSAGADDKDENDKDKKGADSEENLDIMGAHRVHTLFAGCSIVTVSNRTKTATDGANHHQVAESSQTIPLPPDHGAIAYVLRTGFGSSQGALLQMIEFSQQTVSGDIRETGLALLLLFVFALMASGYVLKEGLRKKEKTTHELLLRCVIIITSVVPRQFPMQMAVAVNMALMSLSKAGIFCTEPYRVPLAGKVSHCLFDKTGTITTDQLVPVGIINYNSANHLAGEEDEVEVPGSGNKAATAIVEDGTGIVLDSIDETETDGNIPHLHPVPTASGETAMILAACHSLVVIDDEGNTNTNTPTTTANGSTSANFDPLLPANFPANNLTGDPIELAAIRAIDWSWDGITNTASPDGAYKRHLYGLQIAKAQYQKLLNAPNEKKTAPNYAKELVSVQEEIHTLEKKVEKSKLKMSTAIYNSIQVLQRHHFSSALQRMSVVVKCHNRNNPILSSPATSATNTTSAAASAAPVATSSSSGDHWYSLVKGSPEALKTLISPAHLPSWYVETYEKLARRGLRVLALGYKKVSGKDKPQDQSRTWVEQDLYFGGFIAFECKIRADSPIVIRSLLQSDHKVAMLTGDALLTSLHVAKQVNICDKKKMNLTLNYHSTTATETGTGLVLLTEKDFYWRFVDKAQPHILPFDLSSMEKITQEYNLLTTEDVFLQLVNATGGKTSLLWKFAGTFKVFARMSPQGKANIIEAIQNSDPDFFVFMCGDGGNDVGALKQANVGIALLAGHANANTSEDLTASTATTVAVSTATTGGAETTGEQSAEDVLNAHQKKLQVRNDELNKARTAHMKEFQTKYSAEQQAILQEEIRVRTERGEFMTMFTLMKDHAAKVKQAMAEENMRFMALHGQVWDPKTDTGDGASKTAIEQLMEGMDSPDSTGGLPMVRPGDASVAAPFTSRIPSIRAVVDLIRQGRCTLLSALMQQQIMMLESTISAYTLSSLSLHNARSSERQMMASSWLIVTAALSFSYASPVDHMHPLRPLRSLFHPAIFFSMFGQALIHIACMTLAVHWATTAMGPEKLHEVTEFFQKVKSKEIDPAAHCAEDDFMCSFQAQWMAPFMPNLLNSVVFLVETSQMISVFFTNYKGRPWMKGMLENHPLFLSVFICIGGVIVAAWEMIPQANELIQLAPFPDDAFRVKVVVLVVATIFGTFVWDRLCVYWFAPDVFKASMEEFHKTTFQDFVPLLYTILKIVAGLFILGTGNILLAGLAYWWYRQYSHSQQQVQGNNSAMNAGNVAAAAAKAKGTATAKPTGSR